MTTFYVEESAERRSRRVDMLVTFLQGRTRFSRERIINLFFADKDVVWEAYTMFRLELMALADKNEQLWRLIRTKLLAGGHRVEFAKLKPYSPWAVPRKMRMARRV